MKMTVTTKAEFVAWIEASLTVSPADALVLTLLSGESHVVCVVHMREVSEHGESSIEDTVRDALEKVERKERGVVRMVRVLSYAQDAPLALRRGRIAATVALGMALDSDVVTVADGLIQDEDGNEFGTVQEARQTPIGQAARMDYGTPDESVEAARELWRQREGSLTPIGTFGRDLRRIVRLIAGDELDDLDVRTLAGQLVHTSTRDMVLVAVIPSMLKEADEGERVATQALRDVLARTSVQEQASAFATVAARIQVGHRAPLLTVAAVLLWSQSSSVAARAALDEALSENRDYALAVLLRQVMDAGGRPKDL